MQKSIISENILLSEMIQDIIPKKENKFTDLEIEATRKEEFSLVVYKKPNLITRFINNIKLSIEKLKIARISQFFDIQRIAKK